MTVQPSSLHLTLPKLRIKTLTQAQVGFLALKYEMLIVEATKADRGFDTSMM